MIDINPNSEPEVELSLPDVAKHNWKSQEIRDYWQNDLARFTDAWDELLVAAVCDEEHPRSVVTREFQRGEGVEWMADLPAELDTAVYRGDNTQLIAATSEDVDAEKVVNGEISEQLGRRLRGVPGCCAAAPRSDMVSMTKCSDSTVERGGELVVEEPYPILNQAWSYLGWGFTSFTPCSFECDAARDVAIRNGELLRELGYGDSADIAYAFLAAPTYWSGYHGLAHVKNGWSIGECTTDEDHWQEQTVRFNGYHEELADLPAE
jgi:hypothetical protein